MKKYEDILPLLQKFSQPFSVAKTHAILSPVFRQVSGPRLHKPL